MTLSCDLSIHVELKLDESTKLYSFREMKSVTQAYQNTISKALSTLNSHISRATVQPALETEKKERERGKVR